MQYRDYGREGYQVSTFGMGCMRLPRRERPDGTVEVDREKAYELLRYAADHGVNYFDTAFGYHGGDSERVVGEALEGERRKRVHIATKQPFAQMKDASTIRRNLENTLKKLRTDYLDVYLIHNIQAPDWPEIQRRDILNEYEKFKQEGLIRAIGFSYHGGLDTFRQVLSYYPWAMCQVQQNLLDSAKEVTEEGVRLAGEKGCALVIMEPLRGGGLASAPSQVQAVYDGYPVRRSAAEWAFRYMIDQPQVSCILSGVTTLDQLKDNLRIFSAPDAVPGCLSEQDRRLLQRAKAAYESRVTIPCTGCEYCLPCPQGVAIPAVFQRYNAGEMFQDYNNPRRSYLFLKRAGKDASRCVACGACQQKCPQHIPIIESLKTAHAKLDGWRE